MAQLVRAFGSVLSGTSRVRATSYPILFSSIIYLIPYKLPRPLILSISSPHTPIAYWDGRNQEKRLAKPFSVLKPKQMTSISQRMLKWRGMWWRMGDPRRRRRISNGCHVYCNGSLESRSIAEHRSVWRTLRGFSYWIPQRPEQSVTRSRLPNSLFKIASLLRLSIGGTVVD